MWIPWVGREAVSLLTSWIREAVSLLTSWIREALGMLLLENENFEAGLESPKKQWTGTFFGLKKTVDWYIFWIKRFIFGGGPQDR
jgi:hypothetical protein